jgi:hypothetical protein
MLSITGFMNVTISWCSKCNKNVMFLKDLKRGYTNPGSQDTLVTELCVVVPDVCRSSVSNLPYVTCLASRILNWLLDC